jgi:long-subunit fatty acid transport protein
MTRTLFLTLAAFTCTLAASLETAHGAGLFEDGASARAVALGGQQTVLDAGALDAIGGNPAQLSAIHTATLEVSGDALFLDGKFDHQGSSSAHLHESGAEPAGGVGFRFGRATFGLSFDPEIAVRARWNYLDAPGGLLGTTSYGKQPHDSEIIVLRTALGAALDLTDRLSIGASIGLLYNRNRLDAPYILQSQPVLRGAKTLFDMDTDGYGWDANFGLTWKPTPSWRFGASYAPASAVSANGSARTDARRQFADLGLPNAPATGTYDAEVTNHFPQRASVGAFWQATTRLAIATQGDWINWAQGYDDLDVQLRHGDNRALAAVLGSNAFDDRIPLRWRDQWVWRLGAEYGLSEHWTARAGYSYGNNPVPAETLTPLTAAIFEHKISAGLGYKNGRLSVDAAWQWALPVSEHIEKSDLLSGEYSHSTVRVGAQRVTLTTSFAF